MRVLCVLLLLASLPRLAVAQEALTLERAITSGLANNPSLRAARAAGAEAEAKAAVARSVFFPRVSFSEAWQRGNQPVFVFGSLLSSRRFAAENFALGALNHPAPVGFFHASVGVEQIVFDAGRRSGSRAAAEQAAVADAAVTESAQSLIVEITNTFGRVLSAQAAARAARAALDAGREDLRQSQDRREAGMATGADVLALIVHVADLERRAIQADADAAIARAELNRLTGAAIARDFVAVEPPPAGAAPAADLAALFAEAEAARPELQRAAAAERSALLARRGARAAFLPAIAAHAAVDVSGARFADRAGGWIAGGELRWSLSIGGAERAQVHAAANAVTRAQAEREEARAAVHVDVITALRRLEAAHARQQVGGAAVVQAREAERIVRDRYEAGMASVSDLLRASTAVLDAEANRSAAQVEALVSTAAFNRALGRRPS